MKRITTIFILAFLCGFFVAGRAHAWIHVARDGETLEQLANFYYGDPSKSIIIRAANGFMHPDDGSVLQGERIEIPGITYHTVTDSEDWYALANRYLGSSSRASFLAELNNRKVETSVAAGQIIRIPYQLLYIFAPDETIKSVTKMFMGDKWKPEWLQAYNLKKKKKYGRGDALLIPLINVDYTAAAKKEIEAKQTKKVSVDDKKAQLQAVSQIAELRKMYSKGKYLQIVVTGQKLLANPRLTNPQKIGVYQYLAFAYVAFDEISLATQTFKSALELQPSMELSPITVSPKILRVFQKVQKELLEPTGDASSK
ncbi:MAG: hypothetical protein JXX29_16875 [Deltaproteobacteria bacterium]|nr:hypothetical protein [Deltaproteobacteria bacterium]MBN2673360.1 hypothetical protein [Deltaproteobacteria bacterium]